MGKLNDFQSAKGALSVTLFENQFSDGYYGKVTRRTIDLDNIIADIADNNAGVSKLMIHHIASLLQSEILKLLGYGFSVNVLDLGTLYLAAKGTIKGTSTSDVPTLTVHFTPNELLKKKAATALVEKVVVSDGSPVIDGVEDTYSGESNVLTCARVARIGGSRLKITGEGSGLYLAPVGTDGTVDKDDTKWIKVEKLVKNMPSTLEFYVPDALTTGAAYVVAVRTAYSNGSTDRKECRTSFSKKVTIKGGIRG